MVIRHTSPAMENVVVKASPIHGLGSFARRNILQGERIFATDESRVVTPENPLDPDKGEFDHNCDRLAGGKVVLLSFPGGHVNHCRNPNAYVKYVDGVRGTYARKDIPAGEEITHDYCINSSGDTTWQCVCGSARCRKTIHSDFFHLPLELQLEYLPLLTGWYVAEHHTKVNALRRASDKV